MSEYAPEPDGPVNLKVPPHSVEAEQSVLGGLMHNNEAWFDLVEVVGARDFYRTQHQIIFEAMMDLANADGIPAAAGRRAWSRDRLRRPRRRGRSRKSPRTPRVPAPGRFPPVRRIRSARRRCRFRRTGRGRTLCSRTTP